MTLCAWHLSDLWPGWLGPQGENIKQRASEAKNEEEAAGMW